MKLLVTLIALFSVHNAQAASIYTHINTPAFRAAAKAHYLAAVAGNAQRSAIISTAQSECGGRYEGTEVAITELSHAIGTAKTIIHGSAPDNYTVNYDTDATVEFMINETIKCSFHEGHNRSLLHSVLMSGVDHAIISYVYVGGVQSGTETVSGITRTFSMGAVQNPALYKTPYGTVVP